MLRQFFFSGYYVLEPAGTLPTFGARLSLPSRLLHTRRPVRIQCLISYISLRLPFNLRDYGVTGDGRTNDTTAVSALLTTIGSSPARLIFPPGFQTLLNTISFPANVTLDFSAGGALKPATGQTITILGRIIGTTQQIFYNALPGQGTIDFTGGYALQAVYPEWWGASPGASAATNTPALQAAEYAAFGTNRTNGSGLAKYNRELQLCGMYDINDELQFYHVIGFRITGCGGKFSSGLRQTATNKRILDGQNIAYGVFEQLKFETTASQKVPLVDLDNDHTHGVDLSPQNITFRDVTFVGNGVGQIGVSDRQARRGRTGRQHSL